MNRCSFFVVAVVLAFLASPLRAAPISGRIESIDLRGGTLTVAHDGVFTTYRLRPSAVVTFNGQRAAVADLTVGGLVSIVSDEPNLASRIPATGARLPNASGSVTSTSPAPSATLSSEQILFEKLAGTVWSWPGAAVARQKAWFRLNANGSAKAGWHDEPRTWRVLSGTTIELDIQAKRSTQILRFDQDAREATEDGRPSLKYARLNRK